MIERPRNVYGDLEAVLIKCDDISNEDDNTTKISTHKAIAACLYVVCTYDTFKY